MLELFDYKVNFRTALYIYSQQYTKQMQQLGLCTEQLTAIDAVFDII